MRVITGTEYNTSSGRILIHNEQSERFKVGDIVELNGELHHIEEIIPPTTPNAKWSLKID